MIELKPALIADIPRLWALRTRAVRLSCASHYSPAQIDIWSTSSAPDNYLRLIASQGALIAEEDGQLRGYAILDVQTGEIDAIFVDPDLAGNGLGKQLLLGLETLALQHAFKRVHLFSSLNAVAFYQSAGFTAIRDEEYTHPSGISLRSVYMEKVLLGE
jgi:putative acetyltransferase